MPGGWEASSLEGSPNGGRVPAPPCLLVKMTEGEGAAVPSPTEAVLAFLSAAAPSLPAPVPVPGPGSPCLCAFTCGRGCASAELEVA